MAHQIRYESGPVHSSIGSKIGYRHHQPCRPAFIWDARQNRGTSQGGWPKKMVLRLLSKELRRGHGFARIFTDFNEHFVCVRDRPAIRGRNLLALWTAGRRHDSIHPKIFHHLTVMIHRMGNGERTHAEARHLHLTKYSYLI